VIEQRKDLRFAFEPGEALGIEHKSLWQNLERDVSIEPDVTRPIHLPHAAGSDDVFDLVIAELGAR
jgi:hypothetical protein